MSLLIFFSCALNNQLNKFHQMNTKIDFCHSGL